MIKRQRKLIILFGVAAIVTIIVYFAVISPLVAKRALEAEEEPPELLPGEVLGTNNRILMMEHVEKTQIQEIEVHNKHGVFALYRGKDDEFYIRDNEGAPYSLTMLSSLVVSSGYTLSMTRVSEDCDNLGEYGLAVSDNPAWYKLTKTDGTEHIIYVGDMIPTGAGYYCRYSERNAVYILDVSIGTTLLADITDFITPILSYPVSSTTYFTVDDFYIAREGELFVWIDYMTPEELEDTASTGYGTYLMKFPTNYTPSSTNYDSILQLFTNFTGIKTVVLGNTKEVMPEATLAEYGINMEVPAYELHYTYNGVENFVYFSKVGEDGKQYAYSLLFNLITEVDPATMAFLDWDIIKFVDRPIFQKNINDVATITLESDDINETFTLQGEGQEIIITPKSTGKKFDADGVQNFRQLYKVILGLSMEDYTENDSTENCIATLTVVTDAGVETVYKFYPYSTRRAFYTVNGEGEFYLLRDPVEKMLSDCSKVMAGLTVDSEAKN